MLQQTKTPVLTSQPCPKLIDIPVIFPTIPPHEDTCNTYLAAAQLRKFLPAKYRSYACVLRCC
jgi:hypothetical protein